MKRLQLFSIIVFTTVLLLTVITISPCLAENDKIEWLILSQLESVIEKFQSAYPDAEFTIVEDNVSFYTTANCIVDEVPTDIDGWTGVFSVEGLPGGFYWAYLQFELNYTFWDQVVPGCTFQGVGINSITHYTVSYGEGEDMFRHNGEQEEWHVAGRPWDPKPIAVEYQEILLKTINNWRDDWGSSD
jgi:hypothetical protein